MSYIIILQACIEHLFCRKDAKISKVRTSALRILQQVSPFLPGLIGRTLPFLALCLMDGPVPSRKENETNSRFLAWEGWTITHNARWNWKSTYFNLSVLQVRRLMLRGEVTHPGPWCNRTPTRTGDTSLSVSPHSGALWHYWGESETPEENPISLIHNCK